MKRTKKCINIKINGGKKKKRMENANVKKREAEREPEKAASEEK